MPTKGLLLGSILVCLVPQHDIHLPPKTSTPASEKTKSRQRVHISVPKEEGRGDIHYNVPLLASTHSQDESWMVNVDTSVSKFGSNEKLLYA